MSAKTILWWTLQVLRQIIEFGVPIKPPYRTFAELIKECICVAFTHLKIIPFLIYNVLASARSVCLSPEEARS